jgi:membrane protein YdbS with pleckstrin-like domain
VQVISVGESPLDRRRAMATLHADTAGAGPAGHAIRIRYLARATAGALASDLARRAASVE